MSAAVVLLTEDQFEEAMVRAVERVVERLRRDELDRWLTTAQAADYLAVHHDTVKRAAARRELPFEQNGEGGRLYFKQSALDAWRRGERQ
jgi:excisionase family DNA binding protein